MEKRTFHIDGRDEDIDDYTNAVMTYIKKGVVDGYTQAGLIARVNSLDSDQKYELKKHIGLCALPQCSWAYIGPVLENLPHAAKWAVLVGLAATMAAYARTNDFFTACALGFTSSVATLFAIETYQGYAVNNMWDTRIQRSKPFC